MVVIHRFLERACNYRRDLNSSEVLLALRDVDLREGRHVGPFPRGGPLASLIAGKHSSPSKAAIVVYLLNIPKDLQ